MNIFFHELYNMLFTSKYTFSIIILLFVFFYVRKTNNVFVAAVVLSNLNLLIWMYECMIKNISINTILLYAIFARTMI